jgi:hypothetical protein
LVLRGWFEYTWRFDQESILLNIKKMIQNKELSLLSKILRKMPMPIVLDIAEKWWSTKSEIQLFKNALEI